MFDKERFEVLTKNAVSAILALMVENGKDRAPNFIVNNIKDVNVFLDASGSNIAGTISYVHNVRTNDGEVDAEMKVIVDIGSGKCTSSMDDVTVNNGGDEAIVVMLGRARALSGVMCSIYFGAIVGYLREYFKMASDRKAAMDEFIELVKYDKSNS